MTYKRKSGLLTVMILILVAALAAGALAALSDGFTDWEVSTWFGADNEDDVGLTGQEESSGALIGNTDENGIKLMSTRITPADYSENGVAPFAEDAYTLTATVEPATAANKTVNWSVAWSEPSSAWANGKSIAEYITLSASTGSSCTVTCLQAFGEQAVVTCASADNPEVYATCTVDFRERSIGAVITIGISDKTYVINEAPSLPLPDSGTLSVELQKTAGTVMQDFSYSVDLTFTDGFYGALIDEFGGSIFPVTPIVKTLQPGSFSFPEGFLEEMLFADPSGSVPPLLLDQIYARSIEFMNGYSGDILKFTVTVSGEDSSVNYVYACPMDEIVVPAGKVTLNEDGIVF